MRKELLVEAYGPERAAALRAASVILIRRWPAPDTLKLAETLVPNGWGVVRKSFELLRNQGLGGIAAIPHLAAWLHLAPLRVGLMKYLLMGWEAYAISEGWMCAEALHTAARRALDEAEPGPVADAVAAMLELCDDRLVPLAIAALEGEPSVAQRGAVGFLGTARAQLPEVASALLAFAGKASGADEAGMSYARGEALTAWEQVRRRLPPAPPPEDPPVVEGGGESLARQLAGFRRLVAEGDPQRSRAAASEWLSRALPATPAADALRQEAIAVLAAPVRVPEPPPAAPRAASPVREALIRLASTTEVPAVRIAALQSLARDPDGAAELADLLVEAATDPDPAIREVAARLLGPLL